VRSDRGFRATSSASDRRERPRNCAVCPPRSRSTSLGSVNELIRQAGCLSIDGLGARVIREPSVKSAHTYALLVCDKLWNTFFTRFKDSATVRDVQIFSEFFGFESGCRMDRSRGSRGSALVSVARAAEVDRVFFLCASLSHRGLRSRGGRKPAQRRRRARLHLRTRS